MKEKYYYLRKANGSGLHRCGVVYLIEEVRDWNARGVALCNDTDRFVKSGDPIKDRTIGGIEIARGRALRALEKLKNTGRIKRKEALEKVQGLGIEYKSELNPILNVFEYKLLQDKEEIESHADFLSIE